MKDCKHIYNKEGICTKCGYIDKTEKIIAQIVADGAQDMRGK